MLFFSNFVADRIDVNPQTNIHSEPNPTPIPTKDQAAETIQTPKRKSVWTRKQKIIRVLWGTVGRSLWVLFPNMRSSLLRAFGAKIGRECVLGRDVDIVIPWNIRLGNRVQVGERVILYSLGPITVGDDCVIDTKAHICAGSHDMTDPLFPLTKPPVTIEKNCFVGFDAYIGPDVTLQQGTKIYPRTSIYKSTPINSIWRGSPGVQLEHDGQTQGGDEI